MYIGGATYIFGTLLMLLKKLLLVVSAACNAIIVKETRDNFIFEDF
jgi:hypothetical protein